ncbi:divalent metal cation transporter [Celerinatantimonas sp. YJH-8]
MLTSQPSGIISSVLSKIKVLGPGMLMAAAAIGGSHLVASTQAGARYGWHLVGLIILVNLLKYPFYRSGFTYPMATGQSLLHGYLLMGRRYLALSFLLNLFASVVSCAALVMFSASLLSYFLPIQLPLSMLSLIIVVLSLLIILAGHFSFLNRISKVIVVTLAIATIIAVGMAWHNGSMAPAGYSAPSPWHLASVGFLVITMGWMPAPIEVSCITSLWLMRQRQQQEVTTSSALFDFNLGYCISAVLAVAFLALGALVLNGRADSLAAGGVNFTHQLISIYASTIGNWARYLIAMIAFLCIFGSVITVVDGYARVLNESARLLFRQTENDNPRHFSYWVLFVTLLGFVLALFFKSALLAMLGFAMTLAFITTPLFAWLNHRLVHSMPKSQGVRPNRYLSWLSRIGLIYLFGFLVVFIGWKWFM